VSDEPRVLLVTGASSGIGRATAVEAAGRGWHVVLAARGAASLEEVAGECRAAGAASALVVPTDVGDDDAVRSLVGAALRRHGRLDAVVNAAGVVSYGKVEVVPAEVFDGVLRTNLHGSVNVARHVLPVLRRQGADGHGTLVLVGSVVGHLTVPSMTAYTLSKWGVRALARHLRAENRDRRGVRIAYVAPGGVDTPIYLQAGNYAGYVGRPPPPVASPVKTARQVLARVDHPRRRSQLSVGNDVVRFGHWALPFVYDRIIARSFALGATDLSTPVDATAGNVLATREDGNRLRGGQGSALLGIARNLGRWLVGGRKPR
jgi:NAD(P)-dependent dehydrogenase (short-subunit alcohol dehydrogenase family)